MHDTPKGLAEVLRGLKRGAVVLLMPDAVRPGASPFVIPFADRQMPVMLGPAVLARKTGAVVLPAVSRIESTRATFRTTFSEPMKYGARASDDAERDSPFYEYRFVLELFRRLERSMEDQFLHWQHVRSHFSQKAGFPLLGRETGRTAIRTFLKDPRIRAPLCRPIALD